ncbi:UNVERIFIED_CONTAM: hypothetical protein GTU68_007678 [Idotea baltica]|nr:hypothetical protein [Idotea baltica]
MSLTRPNIILLMADDQGWGDVAYNGHPFLKTPNLDAMASAGARFNRFYAASAVCSPTRASVITGRHPLRFGICSANCGHIKEEELTLGELLREQGYRTGHFGKWHLGTLTKDVLDANRGGQEKFSEEYAPPWDHGFDVTFATESKVPTWNPMITPLRSAGDVSKRLTEGNDFGTHYWIGPGQIVSDNLEGDDSRIIMDRVIPFVEEAVKDETPFLSVVWFHTPHLPVLTGEDQRQSYSGLSEDQQHFYGVITALDLQVGRLRAKLRDLGVSDNTILFYTSDNGPEGKEVLGRTQGLTNGLSGRKRSLHEGGIRVPGTMEWPGTINPGTVVETPCFTSDYFPTIAEILGIDLETFDRPFDGIDIMPLVSDPHSKRTHNMAFEFQNQAALIGERYKIYSADNGVSFKMYDILDDPEEKLDIASENEGPFNDMIEEWNAWKRSQEKSAAGGDYK